MRSSENAKHQNKNQKGQDQFVTFEKLHFSSITDFYFLDTISNHEPKIAQFKIPSENNDNESNEKNSRKKKLVEPKNLPPEIPSQNGNSKSNVGDSLHQGNSGSKSKNDEELKLIPFTEINNGMSENYRLNATYRFDDHYPYDQSTILLYKPIPNAQYLKMPNASERNSKDKKTSNQDEQNSTDKENPNKK